MNNFCDKYLIANILLLRRSPVSERAIWVNWDSGCVSNTSVPRRQCQARVLPTLRRSYRNLRAPVCRQRLRVALAKPKRLLEMVPCWEIGFRHGHRLNTIVLCIIADHTSMSSRKLLDLRDIADSQLRSLDKFLFYPMIYHCWTIIENKKRNSSFTWTNQDWEIKNIDNILLISMLEDVLNKKWRITFSANFVKLEKFKILYTILQIVNYT